MFVPVYLPFCIVRVLLGYRDVTGILVLAMVRVARCIRSSTRPISASVALASKFEPEGPKRCACFS